MFTSLNDLVSQQGQTLNRFEDNISDSKMNTGDTVKELKETLKNEKPNLSERLSKPLGGDLSTTCVLIWFFVAVFMFLVDFHG
jgi:t-SNARE complex subunit (syntaxin)